MIRYQVSPPALFIDDRQLNFPGQVLYSGHDIGLNNPADEATKGRGPIPAGLFKISRWDKVHGNKGPNVAVLVALGNTFGRSAFLIHGDNAAGDFSASDGCIVAGPGYRNALHQSGETDLEVFHGLGNPEAEV